MRIRICDRGHIRCVETTLTHIPHSVGRKLIQILNEILDGKHRPVHSNCFENICWMEYRVGLGSYEIWVWAIHDKAVKVTRVEEVMLIPSSPIEPHIAGGAKNW